MWLTAPLLLFTVGGFYQSPITPTPFSFFPFRYLCSWKCGDLSPWLRAMWLIYHSPHSNSSLLSLLQPLQTDPTSIQERKTCGAGERDCISTLSFHRAGHTTKQSGLHLSIYMESCWVLCIYLWYHQTGFHLVISQQISHTRRTRLSNSRQKKPDSKRQLTFLWRFSSAKINTHLDLFIFLRTNCLTMFKADRYVWVE